MFSFINEEAKNKIKMIKEKFDKYFTIIIGCLWVLSSFWDLIRFHCYWSDYMLELFSSFFFIFMALYFIIPTKIPKIIFNNFAFIKTTLGHSIIMIFFSLLFLCDKHLIHKICSIIAFIGGIIILILELISPENTQSSQYFESNEIDNNNKNENNENNTNDSNPPSKLDDDSQQAQTNLNKINNFNNLSDNNMDCKEIDNKDIIEQN